MSKQRITIETLAAGQPRAYADSQLHVRVTFEWQGVAGYSNKDAPFVPQLMKDPPDGKFGVRNYLRGLCCGFTDAAPEGWWSPRLNFLREVSPGVWEFSVTTPYTD